jgi:hypothetical protein
VLAYPGRHLADARAWVQRLHGAVPGRSRAAVGGSQRPPDGARGALATTP